MTDYALRMAACEGKEAFDTFAQAQAVSTRKGRRMRYPKTIYHCAFCRKFHIGTPHKLHQE